MDVSTLQHIVSIKYRKPSDFFHYFNNSTKVYYPLSPICMSRYTWLNYVSSNQTSGCSNFRFYISCHNGTRWNAQLSGSSSYLCYYLETIRPKGWTTPKYCPKVVCSKDFCDRRRFPFIILTPFISWKLLLYMSGSCNTVIPYYVLSIYTWVDIFFQWCRQL